MVKQGLGGPAKNSYFRFFSICLLITLFILFPLSKPRDYILHIFIVGFSYAMLAASWDLLAGYAGQFSLATAAFSGIGAYTSAIASKTLGISPWLGLLLGGVTAAIASLATGIPSLRLKGPYLALVTLSFSEAIRTLTTCFKEFTGGPLGYYGYSSFPGIPSGKVYLYYIALLLLVLVTLTLYKIGNSRIGLYFKCIRDDEVLAQHLGINLFKYKLLAFAISAFFAGVQGAFLAHYLLVIAPTIMLPAITIQVVAMTLVGGRGTILGPVVGGFCFEMLYEVARGIGVVINLIFIGITLVFVVLFLPAGLLPWLRKNLKI